MEEPLTVDDDPETANAPEPGQRWEFDAAVAASFEDMLERSIPNYGDMRHFVTEAACYAARRRREVTGLDPVIVDLGASRGSALAPIVDQLGVLARYIAVEVSPPMLQALRDRFAEWIQCDQMTVLDRDLREGYPSATLATVVISSLTLQFVPIEYRQALLAGIYQGLLPGGAFILVEKVLGSDAHVQEMIVDIYHAEKVRRGYTQEAVDRKRLALEGVLVPLTARFNEELVRGAGFRSVDCVWAWGSFRGWLAVK